jgi:shikimate kinase
MYRNLCLIGLPYSGKSIIGNKLYKHLNKGFVDTDDIIRTKYKSDLPTLIKKEGRTKFIEIEKDVITSLQVSNMIISTGGSVIYDSDSMNHLKDNLDSEIYHLFLSRKEFLKRSTNLETRGVIMDDNQSITDLYNDRMTLYNAYADKTVSTGREINLDIFKSETYYPSYDYKPNDTYKSNDTKRSYQDIYCNRSPRVYLGTDSYYWNPKPPTLKKLSKDTFHGNHKYNV